MDHSNNNLSHEPVCERYVSQSCPEEWDREYFDLIFESYNESDGDEDFEDDKIFDTDFDSDTEQAYDHEDGGYNHEVECVQDCMQDCVEYVKFGKGMEHNGSDWVWEKDPDSWWAMSR